MSEKPYKRKVLDVFHDSSKHLKFALNNNPNPRVMHHIKEAIKIMDDYYIEDPKRIRAEDSK